MSRQLDSSGALLATLQFVFGGEAPPSKTGGSRVVANAEWQSPHVQ